MDIDIDDSNILNEVDHQIIHNEKRLINDSDLNQSSIPLSPNTKKDKKNKLKNKNDNNNNNTKDELYQKYLYLKVLAKNYCNKQQHIINKILQEHTNIICYNYRDEKYCEYGERCKFTHPPELNEAKQQIYLTKKKLKEIKNTYGY